MRFYQGLLPRIIWDPSEGKPLVEFSLEGVFETEDEKIIKCLKRDGYLVQRDLDELERTGKLAHGGFEKPIVDERELPSGRKPIEDPSNVHSSEPFKRERKLPEDEQADLKVSFPETESETGKAKPKKKIKRRDKK
jgi:hypothetical protein